jgi:hypothetical protein
MVRFLSLAMICGAAVWAAESYTPLDVKTGQWETTMTVQNSGMPPVPQEVLDRLTPEQRAKMEEMMKARASQGPRTNTSKSCLRKEDLEKPLLFGKDQSACKPTIVNSSRSKEEVKIDCNQASGSSSIKGMGTFNIEAVNSETVKINSQMTTGDGTHTMVIKMSGTSKWVGPVCTESK